MRPPVPDRPALAADGLVAGHGDRVVVPAMDLAVEEGTITALVGPNGSGKSTLLMTLARVLRARAGVVRLDGVALGELGSVAIARRLGVLPQSPVAPAGARVREVVEQGRFPQLGPWAMLRRRDDGAIDRALALTGLADLADRRIEALSGGERQRVWIAMTLAQETGVLLLDEPTTALDVRHQLDLMRLVERLRDERGMTVVMVLHDLNQAARHADRLVAMRDGRVLADGAPTEVLTPETLQAAFDLPAVVVADPVTGRPMYVAR